jgi:hypothetical protein
LGRQKRAESLGFTELVTLLPFSTGTPRHPVLVPNLGVFASSRDPAVPRFPFISTLAFVSCFGIRASNLQPPLPFYVSRTFCGRISKCPKTVPSVRYPSGLPTPRNGSADAPVRPRTFLPTQILRFADVYFRKKPRCLRTILPFYAFSRGVGVPLLLTPGTTFRRCKKLHLITLSYT